MLASMGVSMPDCAMPHVDLDHDETYLAGAIKRIIIDKVRPSKQVLARLERQCAEWTKIFPQIPPDYDVSVEHWLEESNYPEWRKAELRLVNEQWIKTGRYKHEWKNIVGSFGKDEQYSDYKHLRTINARDDIGKVLLGPFIHAMEKFVFQTASFVKKIPVEKRFEYLKKQLDVPGRDAQYTDHTAYESVFSSQVVEAVTLPHYRHMWARHPMGLEFLRMYRDVTMNGHTLRGKFYVLRGCQTECSGEMDTSYKNGLGNKFSNEMANAMSVMAEQAQKLVMWALVSDAEIADYIEKSEIEVTLNPDGTKVDGARHNFVCEGDDGVESAHTKTEAEAFSRLGFTVKMIVAKDIEGNDFCCVNGSLDDPACTITDPMKVLGHFGWFGQTHIDARRGRKLALLRARAASLKAMYPNGPIVGALADYVLRMTTHVDMRSFVERERRVGKWKMDRYREGLEAVWSGVRDTKPVLRVVVESRYGITVPHQIAIENYLDSLTRLQFLDCPELNVYKPQKWVDYAVRYGAPSVVWANGRLEPVIPARYDNFGSALRRRIVAAGITLRHRG